MPDDFDNELDDAPLDECDEFRDNNGEPISTSEIEALPLAEMPDEVRIWGMDNYFPDTFVSREGDSFVCHIEDHIYTKFWEHKFSAYVFSEAMVRAARRLAHEGHPFSNPICDDEDVHIFGRWDVRLPNDTPPKVVVESIKAAYDLVYSRADAKLENSDSNLSPIPRQAIAPLAVASIAKCVALQMRCIRGTFNGSNWCRMTPICKGSLARGSGCRA